MTISEKDLGDPSYFMRWSINAGLATDRTNNTLYSYAYLCHKEVKAADVAIDIANKTITYKIYMPAKVVKAYYRYHRLVKSGGIIDLWRARRAVRKYGNLEIHKVLSDFVSKLCGPEWNTVLEIETEETYVAPKDEGDAG
jgi:hypothetical protein